MYKPPPATTEGVTTVSTESVVTLTSRPTLGVNSNVRAKGGARRNGPTVKHQKVAALVFLAPKTGLYRVSGVASSKPWEGRAKVLRLGILKKDTPRAAKLRTLELPRDNSRVPFELTIELTAGHELVFLPLMPDWHNATTTAITDLAIALQN